MKSENSKIFEVVEMVPFLFRHKNWADQFNNLKNIRFSEIISSHYISIYKCKQNNKFIFYRMVHDQIYHDDKWLLFSDFICIIMICSCRCCAESSSCKMGRQSYNIGRSHFKIGRVVKWVSTILNKLADDKCPSIQYACIKFGCFQCS